MNVGGLIFPGIDQADFTGPFEVLSRLPGADFLVIGKNLSPVKDAKQLILTPTHDFTSAPDLDILLVPGGSGVNRLMEDEETLDFIRAQVSAASITLSVCTGALILGAAGLLQGRRATTHWAAKQFLPALGAIPQENRVVVDLPFVFAAGVTSGIDAALQVAALASGEDVARQIQLYIEYAPAPPFPGGTPETSPAEVLEAVNTILSPTVNERAAIVSRVHQKLFPHD
ncbi:cyclohexyl-isocyanide hydratase [Terrimicrobium sacchariphilum]|uniref:Cyclohexyl-isocyanide hydratase n=1 Tax=Terrimicrobium sacchariphilum TaxID=690879 RepID=A0A146G792_TERSA|nr:DJ-1/PfpI family protein [Terrimicrobium sacchariphilum]GAT33430.1 cyclohexyl-isocyanide hydratase [Terrimicrobium sacchariphilum]